MSAAPTATPERAMRVDEMTRVVRYLREHPELYDTILVICYMPRGGELDIVSREDEADRLLSARKRLAAEFFATGQFGACHHCYMPVVWFIDGRMVAWPGLDEHTHEMDNVMPAPLVPGRMAPLPGDQPRRARAIAS